MRFLIRLKGSNTRKEPLLETVRSIARAFGLEARNPKWTSYGALELDVFGPSKGDFDLFVSAVEPLAATEFIKDLNAVQAHKGEVELFSEARDLFNAERYWECHEVLEGVWRQKQGAEKRLLQAIILVCAAFVHHQKGEENVAMGVLSRAEKQMDFPQDEYGGFDIRGLHSNIERILQSDRFIIFQV